MSEGGLNETLFLLEAAMGDPANVVGFEDYLTAELGAGHTGTKTFTRTLAGGDYTVTMSDPLAGDEMLQLDAAGQLTGGTTRNLRAIVRGEPVEALKYVLFGNSIHFDNHNKVNFGITLVTSVYSNSTILIDKGVSINGPVSAVQFIKPNTGPGDGDPGLADTVLNPAGEQSDPSPSPVVPTAPVVQVDPPPQIQSFPSFDFAAVDNVTTAAGRKLTAAQFTALLANAEAYARTLTAAGDLNTPEPLPAPQYPGAFWTLTFR